jgi:hypothetical protein
MYSGFGADGSTQIVVKVAMLETHAMLEIFDETAPSEVIRSATVYINPFVRRQLLGKTIVFTNKENNHEE